MQLITQHPAKKGFTLIELLIVIGILAVLAVITVLVLNPAQLFAQARDSQRLSDLGSIKGAITLYLTTVPGPNMAFAGGTCGTNYWGSVAGATDFFVATAGSQSANVARTTGGSGWVPINLASTTGGSPLPTLPIDPINPNTAVQAYTYACDNTAKTFEINANMESDRYRNGAGSGDDVESTDGGDVDTTFETGTDPDLNL